MIKAYTGEDSFDSYYKARIELGKLSKELKSQPKFIDADEIADVNSFLQQLEGVDMFSPSSLIFAKRLFSNKKITEYLTENFDSLYKYDLIIWHDDKLDGKLKISKKLKDKASLFVSELPKEGEFLYWLKNVLSKSQIEIPQNLLEYMVDHIGINKWVMKNEIDKLKLYLKTKNTNKVTEEDIKKILGFDIKGDIWTFLDAIGSRNKRKAVEEFEKLTFYEDNIQLIIAMLDREFRIMSQILYAKENSINPSTLGINPYVLRKASEKSRNYSFSELKNLTKKLFDLDFAIKKGNVEEKMGLTLLLSTL